MSLTVEVLADPEAVAVRAAQEVAALARASVSSHGRFAWALSGGRTPWAMFSALRGMEVPWERVDLFQVDERVAPAGSPDRNLTHLIASMPPLAVGRIHAMGVNEEDLDAAADRYGLELPDPIDLAHLGLGPDGHTASLVPDDPVLHVTDRLVAVTRPYQGHRRMTLTYPALNRVTQVLWLVTGQEKAGALGKLRAADRSIPAGAVEASDQRVLCDAAAVG